MDTNKTEVYSRDKIESRAAKRVILKATILFENYIALKEHDEFINKK